jgi:hypothetical protein
MTTRRRLAVPLLVLMLSADVAGILFVARHVFLF